MSRSSHFWLVFFALTVNGLLNIAHAEVITERQAAEETGIKGLRLLGTGAQSSRLTLLGIHMGYVGTDVTSENGSYSCGAISREIGYLSAERIASVLLKLPGSSVTKFGLKYVILCSRLYGKRGERIGGFPVTRLNLLMLDTRETGKPSSHLDHSFLHELFHFMEIRSNAKQDKEWQNRFGEGYANSYSGRMGGRTKIGSGKRGFLNAYSETYSHEERAELFAHLLLKPTEVVTHIRLKDDELLRRKTLYLAQKCERLFDIPISLPGI